MRRDKALDKALESNGRFWRIASAGVLFQGGAAAVDTSTIIAALVHGLTGSLFAVGAAAAIARTGWLVPQVIVGYLMEISPDTRRPAYSGYFNALVAPAALLPLAGAAIAELLPVSAVFALSALAAVVQVLAIRRMRDDNIAAPR